MSPKTPLLVGLVLMLAVGGMTWFIMGTSKDTFDEDSTYVLYGDFVDASGIRPKTRLQINGIDVGKIVEFATTEEAGVIVKELSEGRSAATVKYTAKEFKFE